MTEKYYIQDTLDNILIMSFKPQDQSLNTFKDVAQLSYQL